MTIRNIIAIIALAGLGAGVARAEDWPQWRGANRDGQWRETGLAETLPAAGVKVLWRAPVGPGYSGPTVAKGRVYVTDKQGEGPATAERIHCLDAKTGKRVWLHSYPVRYRVGYPLGPRASVTVTNGRAYVLGTMGHFHCLDAATGKVVWKKDLASAYRTRKILWGMASAPLVYEGLVIVQIGGAGKACIVAMDVKTGAPKWSAVDDVTSYSAPVIVKQAGRDVLVCWTKHFLVGLAPTSGKVHWQIRYELLKSWQMSTTTPILDANRLFVSACYDGSMMVTLAENELKATQLWRRRGEAYGKTEALQCVNSTPVMFGGHVYGVDSRGQFRCIRADTGDRVWEELSLTPLNEKWGTVHMVQNGKRTWMFTEQGDVVIAELSPKGFEQISRAKLIEPTHRISGRKVLWSHPAFANRCIYARSDTELVCGDLSAR